MGVLVAGNYGCPQVRAWQVARADVQKCLTITLYLSSRLSSLAYAHLKLHLGPLLLSATSSSSALLSATVLIAPVQGSMPVLASMLLD